MMRDLWQRVSERWAIAVGIAAALLLLTVLLLADAGDDPPWADASLLGVTAAGWAVALGLVALGLGAQLWIDGRYSLARERRLVASSAQLRQASAQLERLAQTDTLTGLANRRLFYDRFGQEFRRAHRYGRDLSVLMLDLDHFKRVNDEHGHQFGDVVLRTFGELMGESVRESDLVARYGGEEFVALLAETTQADAALVAEKLRAVAAAEVYRDDSVTQRVTVSIGVAGLIETGATDEQSLLRAADVALYRAKDAGRDRVVSAEPGSAAPSE